MDAVIRGDRVDEVQSDALARPGGGEKEVGVPVKSDTCSVPEGPLVPGRDAVLSAEGLEGGLPVGGGCSAHSVVSRLWAR